MVVNRVRTAVTSLGLIALACIGAFDLLQSAPSSRAVGSDEERAHAAAERRPSWTKAQIGELLSAIRGAGAEGLQPSDYNLEALQRASGRGATGPVLDALAGAAAASLAHDYAAGRIRNRHRFNWYIDYVGPDADQLVVLADAARARSDLQAWLAGLLPSNRQYRALRQALATTPDGDRRDRILANLERWRWLPRDFGRGDQLYVNLPTYRLDVIRAGRTVASYKAVIGAVDMPTPALSSAVRQVIVNPDWIVPASIVRKSHLRPGSSNRYVFSRRPDGTLRVRQRPGPGNALGKIKIEFPNKLAIYFHDTPSRSLFGASERAFSHGCVRVQNIEGLASSLVDDQGRFAEALAGGKTRGFSSATPLQANIVYLTLVAETSGAITDLGDPYSMDEELAAAVTGRRIDPAHPIARSIAKSLQSRRPQPRSAVAAHVEEVTPPTASFRPADSPTVAPPAPPADDAPSDVPPLGNLG